MKRITLMALALNVLIIGKSELSFLQANPIQRSNVQAINGVKFRVPPGLQKEVIVNIWEGCNTTHEWKIKKKGNIKWFELDQASFTLGAGDNKRLKARVNTTTLDIYSVHSGELSLECLDCKKHSTCRAGSIPIELKVTWSAEDQGLNKLPTDKGELDKIIVDREFIVLRKPEPSYGRGFEPGDIFRPSPSVGKHSEKPKWDIVKLPDQGLSVAKSVEDLLSKPDILSAQPVYKYHSVPASSKASLCKSDDRNWAARSINADKIKDPTGKGVKVAVIDFESNFGTQAMGSTVNRVNCTGGACQDIYSNTTSQYNFRSGNGPYAPVIGGASHHDVTDQSKNHSAGVTGIIAARRPDFRGIAPDVEVFVIQVGSNGLATSDDLANGIKYAIDKNVNVINLSLGKPSGDRAGRDIEVENAIKKAYNKNIKVVAAAGNDGRGDNSQSFPSTMEPEVIAVTAYDCNYRRPEWATLGSKIDIAGPGEDITSTSQDGRIYRFYTGTSYAVPHVTGAVALILQVRPRMTTPQVKKVLQDGAPTLIDTKYPIPRLDVWNALCNMGIGWKDCTNRKNK
jgi:hypothetical protein